MIGCCGRVLPMADVPLDLVARVESTDPDDPERTRTIRGQVAIATTPGHVREILLSPHDPPVNPRSSRRSPPRTWSRSAPAPGTPRSCRTCSCRGCARAGRAQARVVAVLNLEPQPGETDGFSPEEHLAVLQAHLGGVALHTVIADAESVVDRRGLLSAVRECGPSSSWLRWPRPPARHGTILCACLPRWPPWSGAVRGTGVRSGTGTDKDLVGTRRGDAAAWRLTWQRARSSAQLCRTDPTVGTVAPGERGGGRRGDDGHGQGRAVPGGVHEDLRAQGRGHGPAALLGRPAHRGRPRGHRGRAGHRLGRPATARDISEVYGYTSG